MTFNPWPSFTQEEADTAHRVLMSNRVNYWTGDEGRQFEKEFAQFAEARQAIAVSNGTVALDLTLKGLGIGTGDEVIVTPRTFLASASSIVAVGAIPVFADVDRDSQNITPDSVARVLTTKTKAIVAVHLAGWPCEMDGLLELAAQHDIRVIEDCAQAHGARYRGQSVGGLAHAAAWSFCQDKIMTTGGEGGMVTCNDEALWSRMWSYKDHGKSWNAVYAREHAPGFRWLHESFGTNWRLTEMQSAIGRIQLQRMPQWSQARKAAADAIMETAANCPALRVPEIPSHVEHAWYKAYVFVRPETLKAGWGRDRIMQEINALGVPCGSGSCSEVYLEKAFDNTDFRPAERLPIARELGETSLMFMVHPTLSDDDIQTTCEAVRKVVTTALK